MKNGSSSRGPFSFWRRVPVVPDAADVATPRHLFGFRHPDDFRAALSVDLLLVPYVAGDGAHVYCTRCCDFPLRAATGVGVVGRGCGHMHSCPVGSRHHCVVHDPVVAALGTILSAAFPSCSVFTDRRGDQAMAAFRQGPGAGLRHTPDVVVSGWAGHGTHLLVEVKTFDPTAASHLDGGSARVRDRVHARLADGTRRDDYGLDAPGASLPAGMTLGVVSVSTFGSLGPEAHRLLARIARRVGSRIPARLHDLATWAAPSFAPFARMALGLAARRGVAEMIGRMYRRADVEADLDDVDGDGPPAPSFAPLERDPDSSSDDGFPSDDDDDRSVDGGPPSAPPPHAPPAVMSPAPPAAATAVPPAAMPPAPAPPRALPAVPSPVASALPPALPAVPSPPAASALPPAPPLPMPAVPSPAAPALPPAPPLPFDAAAIAARLFGSHV